MDSHDDPEKLHDDGAIVATRAVAFGPEHATEDVDEKAPHGLRPKGVEMKRELTKEDKELANAGYEHLTRARTQEGKEGGEGKMDHVDIVEHKLTFADLQTTLDTAFDAKEPARSPGLSGDEAKARLARDGQNVLTPPKKKSALRKVRNNANTPPIVEWGYGTHASGDSTTTASCLCSTSS